jgi:pimeloyl-ACP methyl ester carboxylesterase
MVEDQMPSITRRALLAGSGAVGFGLAMNGKQIMANEIPENGTESIRSFYVSVQDETLIELRKRILATRWPDRETVADESQGVPLGLMQSLARYWAGDYDWRECEAKLNALPQFMTKIDGLDIHFIHVRSKHPNALPLIVTHGWPGSIIEQLKIIGPLTDPTAFGGDAQDAFHLVIPSMPGYGFSAKPTDVGWDPVHIAKAWVVLMKRLGYTQFVAQGGDWGAGVSEAMAEQAPPELLGIHVNLPGTAPPEIIKALQAGDPPSASLSAEEKTAYQELSVLFARRRAYASLMATRPQTLYGLADSPIALAAWLIDHGDGYGQPAGAIVSAIRNREGAPDRVSSITRDDVLDNITLYWLTNTGVSSGRLYWESKLNLYGAFNIKIPIAMSIFPGENYQAPRSWAERAYGKLIYYNRLDRGGHFAAWEQPLLFSGELRSAFRVIRKKA